MHMQNRDSEEPDALIALVRISGGTAGQLAVLPGQRTMLRSIHHLPCVGMWVKDEEARARGPSAERSFRRPGRAKGPLFDSPVRSAG